MSENVAADELRLLIERIERLEEEKKGIADDIRDVYSEAKANGFDTKIMRKIITLRRKDPQTKEYKPVTLDKDRMKTIIQPEDIITVPKRRM